MIKLTGEVSEDGKFKPDLPGKVVQVFNKHKGRRVEVWVHEPKRKRSAQFNRLYFSALARVVGDYMGVPVHEAHFWLKYYTIGVEQIPNPQTGELIYVEKRTRFMTSDEYADFVRSAEMWAFEQGIITETQLQE